MDLDMNDEDQMMRAIAMSLGESDGMPVDQVEMCYICKDVLPTLQASLCRNGNFLLIGKNKIIVCEDWWKRFSFLV